MSIRSLVCEDRSGIVRLLARARTQDKRTHNDDWVH